MMGVETAGYSQYGKFEIFAGAGDLLKLKRKTILSEKYDM